MIKHEKQRDTKLFSAITLSKFMYIIVCITLMVNKNLNNVSLIRNKLHFNYTFYYKSFIPIIVIGGFQIIGFTYSYMNKLTKKWYSYNYIECTFGLIAYIYILNGAWGHSHDKFIPGLLLIPYAMQYRNYTGYILSSIISAVLIIPTLLAYSTLGEEFSAIFSRDVVLCGGFFFIVYIINTFAQAQDEYSVKITNMAILDGLTGVFNKRYLNNYLKKEINLNSCGHKNSAGIIILDIDYFKTFNDTHGHVRGDKALIEFSNILKAYIGTKGVVARYGGEEFVIVIQNITLPRLMHKANTLKHIIERTYFKGQEFQPNNNLTASIGVAHFPKTVSNYSNIIQAADEALYFSKNNGRNRVTLYSQNLHKKMN